MYLEVKCRERLAQPVPPVQVYRTGKEILQNGMEITANSEII
jgi:hypothetical protein